MKESFQKVKEVLPNPDAKLESIVQSLRGLPGPEFITQLRKIKTENPDIETLIENYKEDKRFQKDIRHGLFFLKKDESGQEWAKDPEFLKQIEPYYYPENTLKDRRRMRRVYGIPAAVMGGLALTAGVMIYEAKQNFKEEKDKEQTWEKQKLPLSVQEIDQQADTIFQSIKGNFYLYEAKDTLEKNVGQHFDQEHENLEVTSRTKITDYLDSLHSKNPEVFKSLVLEYWKSRNDLPSNYYNIAYSPGNIGAPIKETKDNFSKKQDDLNKAEQSLLARIQKAYIDAGGTVYSYQQAVKDVEQQTATPKEEVSKDTENKENPEYAKFREHIDSLATADSSIAESYKEFSEAVNSPLGAEIKVLEQKLQQALNNQEQEEGRSKDKFNFEKGQKLQDLRNQDAKDFGLEVSKESENFSPDVWGYLEDYYLVNEVFNSDLKDTVSEKSLKAMGGESSVKQALVKLTVLKEEAVKRLSSKINEINATFDQEEQKILKEIRQESANIITQIKEELTPKKEKYDITWKETLDEYNKKYNKLWNEELKKQNITTVEPKE